MSSTKQIHRIIKGFKSIKPTLTKKLPVIAEAVKGSIQDRVTKKGLDANLKKMKYALSTKKQKIREGRSYSHKNMIDKKNRIWSQHKSFKSGKDEYTVGWSSGSEGGDLASYNQKRNNFHWISKMEERAIDKELNKIMKAIKI